MIVVTDVTVRMVDQDTVRMICSRYTPLFNKPNKGGRPTKALLATDVIKGKVFKNVHGEEVCLGVAPHVQTILGLPFGAFSDLRTTIKRQTMEIKHWKGKYNIWRTRYTVLWDAIYTLTMWERVMLLFFKGRIIKKLKDKETQNVKQSKH